MSSEIQIIISAVDKASAELGKIDGKTKAFAAGLAVVAGAAAAVGSEVIKVVNETVEYGKQVDDLSRSLGINAKESSKLIQIADDLRIDVGTLKMGFKAALKEGITPNIEGLKGLAKEYQALPTPVEKAQFAMQYFGRAGLELNKILELTPGEIDAMAASAEQAGLVLDEKAVQSTKDYYLALDQLSDSVQGAKTQIGIGLIPLLIQATNEVNRVVAETMTYDAAIQTVDTAMKAGIITQDTYNRLLNDMTLSTAEFNEIQKIDSELQDKLTQDRYEGIIANEKMRGATDSLTGATDSLTGATTDLSGATDELTEKTNILNDSGKKFGAQLIFNEAAMNLDTASAIKLGVEMGVLDSKTILANTILRKLKESLDAGTISSAQYAQRVKDLYEWIEKLRDKTVTVTTVYKQSGEPYDPGKGQSPPGGKKQFGGPVMAGVPYVVGEGGPEMFVPNTSGQIINNWNLTINEAGKRGNVVTDFALMQALARA